MVRQSPMGCPGPRKFCLPPAAWLMAGLVLATVFAANPNFRPRDDPTAAPFGGDFLQEWVGGYLVRTGQADRLYDTRLVKQIQHDPAIVGYRWDPDRYLPIVYPPFYYLVVSPLSRWSSETATLVWAGLMVAALIAAVALWRPPAIGGVTVLAILLFPPLVENFASSQKGTVLLLFFTGTYVLLRRGRRFAAGLLFGLIAFKPQLTLVVALAMLVKREGKFILGGLTSGMALLALSLAVGWQPCGDYLRFALSAGDYVFTAGYDVAKSHSWNGFFPLLLPNADHALLKVLGTLASAATLVYAVWSTRGVAAPDSPHFARQYAMWLYATVLVSPHLLTYDLTFLLLALGLELRSLTWVDVAVLRDRRRAWLFVAATYAGLSVSAPLARVAGIQISVLLLAARIALLARSLQDAAGDAAQVGNAREHPGAGRLTATGAAPPAPARPIRGL